jgi:hypothetical protein
MVTRTPQSCTPIPRMTTGNQWSVISDGNGNGNGNDNDNGNGNDNGFFYHG